MALDPRVLQLARRLAGQALDRLVYLQDGSVIVANSRAHATYMRSSPHFETFGN